VRLGVGGEADAGRRWGPMVWGRGHTVRPTSVRHDLGLRRSAADLWVSRCRVERTNEWPRAGGAGDSDSQRIRRFSRVGRPAQPFKVPNSNRVRQTDRQNDDPMTSLISEPESTTDGRNSRGV